MRALFRGVLVTLLLLVASAASAQTKTEVPQGEIGALLRFLASKQETKCTERCFTLDRLKLRGSPNGTLGFEMEGSVLANHAVAIPLFGPPDKLRIEAVTDDGKPASVGFENGHYYVMTASKRFALKGSLTLTKDLALDIPGPLNTLEADLTSGRVVEGARLAGLSGTTIHFDSGAGTVSEEPTVFQLSRAVRVLREIGFEYRLTMRSGSDLGVVRLPLAYGEKVLEVSGSTGWKVEGTELVLPTAGKSAVVTITGTLADATRSFSPDARSPYEWWLLESDAEHRLTVSGDAKQLDAVESPIPKTQPTGRLFLVKRGEKMSLQVQTLASLEALAAVVREHMRTVVLTQDGDLVSDDVLRYENNGVDFLAYGAAGRPIFLATDGSAERILRKDSDATAMMIPLRKGAHAARVQSLSRGSVALLFGRLDVPTTDHALTASRATVTIGLPARVHPIAVLGGDRTQWLVPPDVGIAAVVSLVLAWLVMTTRRDRVLLGLSLFGLSFVSIPAFGVVSGGVVLVMAIRLAARKLRGRPQAIRLALGGSFAALALVALVTFASTADKSGPVPAVQTEATVPADRPANAMTGEALHKAEEPNDNNQLGNHAALKSPADKGVAGDDDGKSKWKEHEKGASKDGGEKAGFLATDLEFGRFRLIGDGRLDGVAPVALSLPGFERSVVVSRELVTRDRPFQPAVLYLTETAILATGGVWLLVVGMLVISQRARLLALRDAILSLAAPTKSDDAARAPTPAE